MSFLLKEDGSYLLQETGDKIILDELHIIVSAIKNVSILTTKNKKSIMRSNNSNRTNL